MHCNVDTAVKDWDEIIPEEDRMKMEEEERQEQLKELNLPPRSRKQVNEVYTTTGRPFNGRSSQTTLVSRYTTTRRPR